MKVELYTTNNGFNQGLSAFTTASRKIDEQVHRLLMSAIYLAAPGNGGDRNVDRVRRVLDAMPKQSRRKAAIHWCREFAPLSVTEDKKLGLRVNIRKDHKSIEWTFDVDKAMNTPFWEFTKERNPAPVDPAQMVKGVINTLTKAIHGEGNRPLKGDPDLAERTVAGLQALQEEVFEA